MDILLPDPVLFASYDAATQSDLIAFVASLSSLQRQAYLIGKQHLGTSFHLLKSNGFIDWKKNQAAAAAAAVCWP